MRREVTRGSSYAESLEIDNPPEVLSPGRGGEDFGGTVEAYPRSG